MIDRDTGKKKSASDREKEIKKTWELGLGRKKMKKKKWKKKWKRKNENKKNKIFWFKSHAWLWFLLSVSLFLFFFFSSAVQVSLICVSWFIFFFNERFKAFKRIQNFTFSTKFRSDRNIPALWNPNPLAKSSL